MSQNLISLELSSESLARLDQAIAATGVDFAVAGEKEDVDTVAGFIATIAGRIPDKGEIIALSGEWEFEIVDSDRRRIKLVNLKRILAPDAPPADPAV